MEFTLTADTNDTDLTHSEVLWKTADALRGQIDAAEYKHVVMALLFLKYISDSFEARRDELRPELEADGIVGSQLGSLLENRDEYTAERVFWVPPEARWQNLQDQAPRADIAALLDDAILEIEFARVAPCDAIRKLDPPSHEHDQVLPEVVGDLHRSEKVNHPVFGGGSVP